MGRVEQQAWNDARRDRAKALWKEGYSAAEVARRVSEAGFKPTRSAIIGLMYRAGLSGAKGEAKSLRRNAASKPAKPKLTICSALPWTDEEKAVLTAGFDHGDTATQIARALKVAGSNRAPEAVASKLRHMGLTRSAGERNESARLAIGLLRGPAVAGSPPPPPAQIRAGEGVSLLALESGMCRWPIGERGGEAVFCGRPVSGFRKPYCPDCGGRSAIARPLHRLREPYDPHSIQRSMLPKKGFIHGV